jgi:glutamate carboxypeptidase
MDCEANGDARLEVALAWLREQKPAMLELLERLVTVNSFTGNRAGGNRVGALLRRALDVPRLVCTPYAGGAYADALVFSTAAKGPPVLIVGHLDTVFPPGTFETYRSDGVHAYGPGVLDMKGGLVVAAFTVLALDHAGLLDGLPIRFIVVADEEVGSPASRAIFEAEGLGARCGLVVESGRPGDAVITRRKGVGSLVATAHGTAAHAGNAHAEGVNAIWALSRFIDRAQALTDAGHGISVNVGTIAGGQSKNTVPDWARAEIDIRFCNAEDGQILVAKLGRLADAAGGIEGARIELEKGASRQPMQRSEASDLLLADYLSCATASGLGAVEAPLVGGGSDANTLAAMGVACIDALGPRGTGLHSREERIEVGTLVPKAEALTRLLASFR